MKKQLLSIALIIGASSSAVLAHQYTIKNTSDLFAFFTFYDVNNKMIFDVNDNKNYYEVIPGTGKTYYYEVAPGETYSAQLNSKVGRVVVQYVSPKKVVGTRIKVKHAQPVTGEKMASFVRENGVGSGTFTFSQKDGITFKPDLATKASDTWKGLKSRFK